MKLFFSNRIEALAGKMSEFVFAPGQDPFVRPLVLLPNPNLEKWLRLQWSQQFGCVAGINFCAFETGLFQLLRHLHPEGEKITMLDETMRRVMVAMLLERYFADSEPVESAVTDSQAVVKGAFSDYILGHSQKKGGMEFYLRIQQLAGKLAGLFREYEYHRPEMIKDWLSEKIWFSGMGIENLERAQKILYRDFAAAFAGLESSSMHNLFSLFQEFSCPGTELEPRSLPEEQQIIQVFAVSQVSALHMRILEFLGSCAEIYIYCLNPCCEYWEDVRSAAEIRWHSRNTSGFFQLATEDPEPLPGAELLSLWGRAGRENVRNLCALTDYDIEDCYFAWSEPQKNLFHIQNSLLTLSGSAEAQEMRPDDSFGIIKAGSRREEIAFIARSIREQMSADPDLRLSDIALLLPDVNAYRHLIELEFRQSDNPVIYNMVDSAAGRESLYGLFITAFFELCAGEFSRKEVFHLIGNQLLRQKWDITAEELQNWAVWCEKLGIFRHYECSSYDDRRAFTWKQGLQRMRLARILEEQPLTESGDGFADLPPWRDLSVNDHSLEKFSRLLEFLHVTVQKARTMNETPENWRAFLSGVEDGLILFADSDRGEKGVAENLKEALSFMDLLSVPEQATVLGYEAVQAFFIANMRDLTGGTGEYLVQGVCISALLPMRPIPFRIIYVAGLEDGSFPGRADKSVLDLRQSMPEKLPSELMFANNLKRRDISRPERNQWLFLESLVCAREKLFLCYTGFDPMKDREVLPSALIRQLQRWLSLYMSEEIAGVQETGAGNLLSSRSSLSEPLIAVSAGIEPSGKMERKTVSLRELARFLADPIEARKRLFLRNHYEDDGLEEFMEHEDEPFLSDFPHNYNLLLGTQTELMQNLLRSADSSADAGQCEDVATEIAAQLVQLPEIFQRRYKKLARRSLLPNAGYGEFDAANYRGFLTKQAEMLQSGELVDFLQTGKKRFRRQKLELLLDAQTVLTGEAGFWARNDNLIQQVILTGTGAYALRYQVFESLLFFICTVITEAENQGMGSSLRQQESLFFYRESLKKRVFKWPAGRDIAAAGQWLCQLVQDYYGQCNYGTPNLKLFKGTEVESDIIVESFYDYGEEEQSDWLTKIFYRPLDENSALELFNRRYGFLWEICPELWSEK
jgi:exonuclease V gamma subunit